MVIRSTLRHVLLASVVAVTGALPNASLSSAQDEPEFEPDAYVTVMTEQEIRIEGDTFVISNVLRQNYPDGENEQVFIDGTLDSGVASLLEVSWLDDSDTPDETIDLWVRGLAEAEGIDNLSVVDAGLDGDVYWYYVTGSLDEQGFVFYIQVTEDVTGNVDMLESALTTEGSLVEVIGAAQADVTIGGDAFMDDVDLDDLEGLVSGEPFRDGENGESGSRDEGEDGDDVVEEDDDDGDGQGS